MNDTPFTPQATPRRPGWQTTEFWVTLAILAADGLAVAADLVAPEKALLLGTISAALYKAARTAVKFAQPGAVAVAPSTGSAPAGRSDQLMDVVDQMDAMDGRHSILTDGESGHAVPGLLVAVLVIAALVAALPR